MALSAPDSAAFASAVDDIRVRIEPTLGTSTGAIALHGALARVSAAMAARDRAGVEAAVSEGESALALLARAQSSESSAAPDLDAVRLVLTQAGALLSPSSDAPSVTP